MLCSFVSYHNVAEIFVAVNFTKINVYQVCIKRSTGKYLGIYRHSQRSFFITLCLTTAWGKYVIILCSDFNNCF